MGLSVIPAGKFPDPFPELRQTMSAPSAPSSTGTAGPVTGQPASNIEKLPHANTLLSAAKLAIQKDMAIQLDYFVDSADGKAFLGQDAATEEKMLVKSAEEYTSHIQKIYKAGDDFIVMTENSIYIVSGQIQKRKIQSNSLKNE